jgi:hypothetical protein
MKRAASLAFIGTLFLWGAGLCLLDEAWGWVGRRVR